MGASCAGNLGREALSSKSSPPSPSNLSMHLNTSLTERGGLPLLAAWLAGASVCAVFALIACFALPVVFSAQGGQIFSWVWRPDTHEFGILPMIVGSLLLSVSALLLSWPLAVGVACAIQDGGKNASSVAPSRASSDS